MSALRRVAPLLLWVALVGAVLTGMTVAGSGPLASPDLGRPSTWAEWVSDRRPADAVVAVLRLTIVAVCWYLLAVTALTLVARAARVALLARVTDLITVPVVRRLLHGGIGVGLAGAAVAAGVPASSAASPLGPPAHAAVVLVADQGEAVRPPQRATEAGMLDDETPPVMVHLGEAVLPSHPVEDASPAGRTWTVAGGDHLWSVAERVLADAWQRPVTDQEVTPFWTQVVQHNLDRLADPDNPDLVFPGQVLTVPSPPPAPAR